MAQLRATQLYAGIVTAVNPAKTTIYTVPAGHRVILKSITMRNASGGTGITVYVFVGGVTVFTKVLAGGGVDAGSFEWRPWVVIDEGESLQVSNTLASGVNIVASGAYHYL